MATILVATALMAALVASSSIEPTPAPQLTLLFGPHGTAPKFATATKPPSGQSIITNVPAHLNHKRRASWTSAATVVEGTVTRATFPDEVCGYVDYGLNLQCPPYSSCVIRSGIVWCGGEHQDWARFSTCTEYDFGAGMPYFAIVNVPLLACNVGEGGFCLTGHIGTATGFSCVADRSAFPVPSVTFTPVQDILPNFGGSTISLDSTHNFVTAFAALPTTMPDYAKNLKGAPKCIEEMDVQCPLLSSLLTKCGNPELDGSNANLCYCDNLIPSSCNNVCATSRNATSYINWVAAFCKDVAPDWADTWVDYTAYQNLAYQELFPWDWQLSMTNLSMTNSSTTNSSMTDSSMIKRAIASESQCPSTHSMLASFATINAVVFVGSIILANRHVVNFITFGFCAKPGTGSYWWVFTALLGVGLNLLGNFVNALLIRRTPGFENAPVGQLILLWCTRPRLAWMVILLALFAKWTESDETIFIAGAVSAVLAEMILQLLASIYMGITVHYVARHGYYKVGKLRYIVHGHDAWIMYAGALLWLVWIWLAMAAAILTFNRVRSILKFAFRATWTVTTWPFTLLARRRQDRKWRAREGRQAKQRYEREKEEYLQTAQTDGPMMTNPADRAFCYKDSGKNPSVRKFPPYDSPEPYNYNEENSLSHALLMLKMTSSQHELSSPQKAQKGPINQFEVFREMGLEEKVLTYMEGLFFLLLIVWMAQWLFWAGFLRLAVNVYCPPKIWTMTGVWSGMSTVAVLLGASN